MSNGRIKRSRSVVRSRTIRSRRWRSSSSREEGQVKKKHQQNKETRRSKEGASIMENR